MLFKCKKVNVVELQLLSLIILVSIASQLNALRSPYFATGKYKAIDVDDGHVQTVQTIDKVI
jgi:hypothetical protein